MFNKKSSSFFNFGSNQSRSLHTNPVYDYKGAWKTYKGAKWQAFALGIAAIGILPLWVYKVENEHIRTVYVFDGRPSYVKIRAKLHPWGKCIDCGVFDRECMALCKQIQAKKQEVYASQK
ncbi:hypothetical protein ABK040_009900 [Willaertia magna]